MSNSIEICRNCIDNGLDTTHYKDNDWESFNTKYCVTDCNNNLVPKYIPKEQVIKYLKRKI